MATDEEWSWLRCLSGRLWPMKAVCPTFLLVAIPPPGFTFHTVVVGEERLTLQCEKVNNNGFITFSSYPSLSQPDVPSTLLTDWLTFFLHQRTVKVFLPHSSNLNLCLNSLLIQDRPSKNIHTRYWGYVNVVMNRCCATLSWTQVCAS